ncbi:MAG: carotenoid oxygenase family protein [Myxococcales bacterium]|nr:carotenoid oxygenase family protein [Myxococcales bacterium]
MFTRSLAREHGFAPLRVDGALPPELRGTLVRNGPGLFGQFGRRYAHSFEGDGLITAVRLDGAGAHGACRLTASAGLTAERAAGKVLYGTGLGWPRRFANAMRGRRKNTANTHVVPWQGRLLALMEAARPTELALTDADVRTIGETDLGGVVGSALAAHPHRVAARATMFNFGVEYGRRTRIVAYELPDVGAARRVGEVELGFAPMLHDFIATERHLVWLLSPAAVNVPRMLLQLGGFDRLFGWRPELGTEVIVMPIDQPTQVTRFTVDAFYQWHFANAFERGDELVVDYVRYPNFDSFGGLADGATGTGLDRGRLHRAVITPGARRFESAALLDEDVEFPRIHPDREGQAHGVTWLVSGGLREVVAHHADGRVRRHRFAAHEAVSEPVFVPRPGATAEDDGWVVALVYDGRADASYLAVLDGVRLEDGPIARAWFDHPVPITFHGSWLPAPGAA